MTETLKECPNPWCNKKRRMARVWDIPAPAFRVICGCGVMGPMMLVEAEAITAWNTRPREAELEAEVGRLREGVRRALTYMDPMSPGHSSHKMADARRVLQTAISHPKGADE